MKPFHYVAFAVALSFAAVQGQPIPAPPERPAIRTISADLLRHPLPRKAKQVVEKAQRAAEAGDHARAISLLETARDQYPESDAWTQSMLGVEYLKTGQFASALTALEQAVLLLPNDPVDRSNLGFALAATGQYDRAEQELQRAIALDNSDLSTKKLLATIIAVHVSTQLD
jgi:Flp pilus assembly protein TadD